MDLVWLIVGIAPTLAGAYLLARRALAIEAGVPRVLAAAVLSWAGATVGVELVGTLGHLDRPTLVGLSVVLGGVFALCASIAPRRDGAEPVAPAGPPGRLGWATLGATVVTVWVGLRFGIVSIGQPVKVVSDGPIYHLYFAARWWRAGGIVPVAAPFGEVGAPYFWANGEVWYAILMTLFDGDRLARAGQVPFFVLTGLAVAALGRELGANPRAARLAAFCFLGFGPLFPFAFEPNVDLLLVAGYSMAVLFFVRACRATGAVDRRSLLLGSLAAGLGMGTKPTGIVFVPPLLVLVATIAAVREWRAGRRRRIAATVALVLLPAAATMAYWPIRNLLRTGNPLYPLHVAVGGRVILAGWFGPDAMRFSPFYFPATDWRAWIDSNLLILDPRLAPLWMVAALGGWAVGRRRGSTPNATAEPAGRVADRWVVGLTLLGLFNLAACWLVIPYRTQLRFSFPGYAVLAIPLARLLDRSRTLERLAAALVVLHLLTPEPWPFGATDAAIPWNLSSVVPNATPPPLILPTGWDSFREPGATGRHLASLLLGLAATAAVLLWDGQPAGRSWWRRRWVRRVASAVVVVPFALGAGWTTYAFLNIPFPMFPDFMFGWEALEKEVGPRGARVAYAGNKIPYYLMGSKLQNEVRYINIDEHRDWLMHDYHRDAANVGLPATWPTPFPGWDRLNPDYDAWLLNLRAERIEYLVVTRVNIEEGPHNVADAERFPIERRWADAHPDVFRPVYGPGVPGTRIRVYRVRDPAEIAGTATDRAPSRH